MAGKRAAAKKRRQRERDAAPLANDYRTPARHTGGERQIAGRSSEADRERLAHLPATVFDYDGVAAWVAGEAAPCSYTRRPETDADRLGAAHGAGPKPPGRGAPMELLENIPPALAAVEARVARQQDAGPRMIARPRNDRERYLNELGPMTPLRRLAYMRRTLNPAPTPETT